jgi:hypothetical protein
VFCPVTLKKNKTISNSNVDQMEEQCLPPSYALSTYIMVGKHLVGLINPIHELVVFVDCTVLGNGELRIYSLLLSFSFASDLIIRRI